MLTILALLGGAAGGVGWAAYRLKGDATWTSALRDVVPFLGGPGPFRPK